jgi:hypothetical protein
MRIVDPVVESRGDAVGLVAFDRARGQGVARVANALGKNIARGVLIGPRVGNGEQGDVIGLNVRAGSTGARPP